MPNTSVKHCYHHSTLLSSARTIDNENVVVVLLVDLAVDINQLGLTYPSVPSNCSAAVLFKEITHRKIICHKSNIFRALFLQNLPGFLRDHLAHLVALEEVDVIFTSAKFEKMLVEFHRWYVRLHPTQQSC